MFPVRLLWILPGLTVHVVGQQQVGDLVLNIYLQVASYKCQVDRRMETVPRLSASSSPSTGGGAKTTERF